MSFQVMKVFDCQDMPEELRNKFVRIWDNKCNDVYVHWHVADSIYDEDDDPCKLVDEWLLANGAKEFEQVLIKYWW